MNFYLALLIAFFCGSIPTGYLLGRIKGKIDIRQHGSGNVGATNAYRVLGKKYGILVLGLDILKGFAPIFLLKHSLSPGAEDLLAWVALAPVLGHIYSPFLNFKGGKGIAVGGGVVLALNLYLFFLTICFWVLIFVVSRIVSVSSLLAVAAMAFFSHLIPVPHVPTFFYLILLAISLWTHRSNIDRYVKGQEKTLY